ncbi:MAG: carboxypeptidase-like regulatory domain-containing protein [Chitinophagaceae bacterium]
MKNCGCHTEITRDGSGQLQRYLKALDPSYAPVDGRNIEDLLVFAKRYAAQIRFYDLPVTDNANNGTTDATKISWREFFRRDMAVVIASVALTEPESFKREFNEIRDKIEQHPTADLFAALFGPITGMLKKIDHWYSVAIPENPLYNDLVLAIDSDLRNQVRTMMEYKKQFNVVDPSVQLKIDLDNIENPGLWGIDRPFSMDSSLYVGNTKEEKISYAALNVEDIFYSFYNFLSQAINESGKYLAFAINEYPGHQPHMALFITFLELFRIARDQMNGLTERMLNFYYREVLRLQEKSSIPDKAHIVFELAAEIAEYDIKQGTSLSAGDDLSGQEQIYKTTEDFVVNQAKVAELKTIFVEKKFLYGDDAKEKEDQVIHALYARPVANSLDGFGEKFTDPYPKWSTFGEGGPTTKEPKNICDRINLIKKLSSKRNDLAQIGFAISSPQLLMEGGKRLVQVIFNEDTFSVIQKLNGATGDKAPFRIWFTGDKGWFKIDRMMTADQQKEFTSLLSIGIFKRETVVDKLEGGSYYFDLEQRALSIYLPISDAAVVGYDTKLHKKFLYSTDQPIMQVMVNPEIDLSSKDYQSLSVKNLSLRVKVGSVNSMIGLGAPAESAIPHFDGLNKLSLHTENGLQEAGKPFDPYSPYPARGKFFYISSNEVFNKPLKSEGFPSQAGDKLAITIRKTKDSEPQQARSGISVEATSDPNAFFEYRVDALDRKDWTRLSILASKGDFSQAALTFNILSKAEKFNETNFITGTLGVTLSRLPLQPVAEWRPGIEKGFLRITNLRQTETKMEERQAQASQLEIAEVYLSYDSTLLSLDTSIDKFYHVYPFGNVQVYTDAGAEVSRDSGKDLKKDALQLLPVNENDPLIADAGLKLLPHFTYLGPYEQYNTVAQKYSTAGNSNIALNKIGRINVSKKELKGKRREQSDRLILDASGLLDKLNGGSNQYSALSQEEGMLQIGLENLKPLQTISLLFQFAEGSAEDEDKTPPDINWSYLANNEWKPLKAENLVADGTSGFQTTGIVQISVPEEATRHHSITTDGLTWLCASVTKDSNRIPQLVDVVTQATEVIFEDNQNDQSHFDKALPAGTISKLVVTPPEVSKVTQPFASFDGKHHEIGREFYTRVSERLRHKHRAITPWDYEHLVLNRFPSIYKVKCITYTDPECLCRDNHPRLDIKGKVLPANVLVEGNDAVMMTTLNLVAQKLNINTSINITLVGYGANGQERVNKVTKLLTEGPLIINHVNPDRINSKLVQKGDDKIIDIVETATCCGPQIAPGHVLLVPIADLKNRNAINPLQPKTSRRTLLDIEAYLKKLTSPFVHVHAKNPVYEQVLVFFRVKFYPQYDIGYYIKDLNNEIVHFLTPWAFDEKADVKFGQKIYASSIINFIEEKKYVDFITDFIMVVCKDECCSEAQETKVDAGPDDILAMVKITGATTTEITGKIVDKIKDQPLKGITVTAGGTSASTITDATGDFILQPATPNNGTISFSLAEFKPAYVDIVPNQEQELVFKKQDDTLLNEWGLSKKQIEELCGCSGVEYLFEDETSMPGDIVTRPSTARSILVSAPKHIIIPYKEPPYQSPCERNTLSQKKLSSLTKTMTVTKEMALAKPVVEIANESIIAKADTGTVKKTKPASKSAKKNAPKKNSK